LNNRPPVKALVLVSGNGTNLQALIDAVKAGGLPGGEICGVVADRDGAYALERAGAAGIPAFVEAPNRSLPRGKRRRDLSDRVLKKAREREADFIILAGFLSILEGPILGVYEDRIINLHPALLPKFGGQGMYGEHVHRAVLDAGERESGCTVHLVTGGIDAGPVLLSRSVPVLPGDTPESLADRIHHEEHIAIVEATARMIEKLCAGGNMKKRALISVFNKDGIDGLASFLIEAGWEILSTGKTSKYMQGEGIPVTDVSAFTGFPECLDGRVKTLHPAIHAGLLARRDVPAHGETLEKLGLKTIDLVCVNLYPFFEKVQAGLSLEETVEFIDIGGPAMLRSAAKNYRDVVVLTDPADYPEALAGIKAGKVPNEFRKRLAGKVFDLTSAYDAAIARYLLDEDYPAYWPMSLKKAQSLRYGENSHQSASLYFNADRPGALSAMEQLHGKELSYNNIRDLDLAWKAVCALGLSADGTPPLGEEDIAALGLSGYQDGAGLRAACVAVKHNSPCGIAQGASLGEAYAKTFACDPVSIFGGIVACNVPVDKATAEKFSELFLEIVAAPGFEDGALEILKQKKNLRIIRAAHAPREQRECISVDGGLLVQDADRKLLEKWETVTKTAPLPGDIPDMIFGMRAVSYVKSNAVMVVKDQAAAGIGGGQVNRIWAARQALDRGAELAASSGGEPPRVLASDAFFPFPDVVEAAASSGIKAIVQPGGSLNDKLSIEACDKYGIAMVFTGTRRFKH
jgi:phosphoribosylaminoimidazolecarboxamide formyltransferase/IMP cyclohydrolase